MTRPTTRNRDMRAGCFVCFSEAAKWTGANAQALAARHHDSTNHTTWCELTLHVRYGDRAADARQIDIEDAIASASSGGGPDAVLFPGPDAPAVAVHVEANRRHLIALPDRSAPDAPQPFPTQKHEPESPS